MMDTRVKLALLVINCLYFQLEAQQSLTEVKRLAYGNPFTMSNENFINMTNSLEDDAMVSLLMFEDWKELEVTGATNEMILIDSANYHLEADKILFIEGGRMFELFPEKIRQAQLGGKQFVSLTYEVEKKELRRGYFETLIEGDFNLLKHWELERRVTNSSPLGLPAAKELTITRKEALYYQTSPDRRPIAIPTKKTDFINIFRRDRRQIMEYAKSNKLSPRAESDVVLLFEYYNSLLD